MKIVLSCIIIVWVFIKIASFNTKESLKRDVIEAAGKTIIVYNMTAPEVKTWYENVQTVFNEPEVPVKRPQVVHLSTTQQPTVRRVVVTAPVTVNKLPTTTPVQKKKPYRANVPFEKLNALERERALFDKMADADKLLLLKLIEQEQREQEQQ